jgi:hypothetical protein
VTDQETAATLSPEATVEKLKDLNERFTALVARLQASQETHDEERAVRLLAWKVEWDTMMRERNVAIGAHLSHSAANAAVTEQARVVIATREAEMEAMEKHRLAMERIYDRGFTDITSAIRKGLDDIATSVFSLGEQPVRGPDSRWGGMPGDGDVFRERCTAFQDDLGGTTRCTRNAGHTGNHANGEREWA